jgi:hypothetical protein
MTTLDNLAEILLERRVHGGSVSDRNVDVQQESTLQIRRRAITAALGEEPSLERVTAFAAPRSVLQLLAAARLIVRLYLASPRGPAVRRDVRRRIVAAANAVRRK